MSRSPNELTAAIRQLCDETNGEITHIEARPRLEKMGFEIAPESDRKSAEYAQWEQYEVDYDDPASINAVAKELGFDEKTAKRMVKEHQARKAFELERNTFNVAKYNWRKGKESGKPSVSRPAKSRNQKSQVAKEGKKKRRGRKPRTAETVPAPRRGRRPQTEKIDEISEMVALVQKHGGVQACHERVAELKAEMENAQSEIDALNRAVEVVSAAVKAA